MNNDLEGILSYLEMRDKVLEQLVARTIELCKTKDGAEEAIKELQKDITKFDCDVRTCEKIPFCNLLIGYAYFQWDDMPAANRCVKEAERGFRCCGDRWNLALALWFKATIYSERPIYENLADAEYQSSYSEFQSIYDEAKRVGLGERHVFTELIMERISNRRRELNDRLASGKSAVPPGSGYSTPPKTPAVHSVPGGPGGPPPGMVAATSGWSTSRIYMLVHDLARAGSEEEFVLDSEPRSIMFFGKTEFDNVPHRIYQLSRGGLITMAQRGDYRWIKANGNGMNQATPVPIGSNNYLFVDVGMPPETGDVVLANLRNPPTLADRAGVVRRYTAAGLKAESTETIPTILLPDAAIRGVVLAVAKPEQPENFASDKKTVSDEPQPKATSPYEELLRLVQRDEALAERLIRYEKEISPGSSWKICIDRAIARLVRDRQ